MGISLEQIIDEDLSLLRNQAEIGSKLGKFIDAGSYGFVVEYLDNSSEKKVIKILDPKYVNCSFRTTHPQIHTTLLTQRAANAGTEWDLAQKVGYTKSPHLMPLMSGPKKIDIDGRSISFLVMPRLQTIEDLELAHDKERQIVSILSDCCEGLQVLHRHPEIVGGRKNGMDAMVHCDIKPNNIFFKPEDPSCFMIGDYSIAQKMTDLEHKIISISSSHNPYCAQGPLEKTSDIFALGWVLFYWMNGKKHPTMQDVASRQSGTLELPPSWGNNPELWNIFLQMTEPIPSKRFQRAEDVKAALQTALQNREKRLSDANALKQYDDGKSDGQFETAGLVILITAAWSLLKWIFGSDPIPSDGNGQLHGTIKKDIPYLRGKFRGTWERGCPKDGTYISPTGIKRTGQWIVRENFKESFMNTGEHYFTGLSLLESGQETSYQGHVRIQWPWGTRFVCDLEAGRIVNGNMTFSDGTQIKRNFEYRNNPDSFVGILCNEENENFTGCAGFSIGPEVYVECELINNIPGPGKIFLPGSITICHTNPTYENVMDLLVNMINAGGHFRGSWNNNGFPKKGTYVFSDGQTVTGDFSFVINKRYPQCVYTGMISDDDLPWGVGTAQYSNGRKTVGEFFAGSPLKE